MTLALASACGGTEFSAAAVTAADAGEPDRFIRDEPVLGKDAGAELVDELERAGDVYIRPDAAAEAEAATCDLKPCQCGDVHMAICCDGPCPAGFEGLSCYCGNCKFGQSYDAGRCY